MKNRFLLILIYFIMNGYSSVNMLFPQNIDEKYVNYLEAEIYREIETEIKSNFITNYRNENTNYILNNEIKKTAKNAFETQKKVLGQIDGNYINNINKDIINIIEFFNNLDNYENGFNKFLSLKNNKNISDYEIAMINSNFNILWCNRVHYLQIYKNNESVENQSSYNFIEKNYLKQDIINKIQEEILLEKKFKVEKFKEKYIQLANKNIIFEVYFGSHKNFYNDYIQNMGNKVTTIRHLWILNDYFKFIALNCKHEIKEGDVIGAFPILYDNLTLNAINRDPAMVFSTYGVIKIISINEKKELKLSDNKNKVILEKYEKDIKQLKDFLLKMKIKQEMQENKYFNRLPKPLKEYLLQAPKYEDLEF